MSDYRPVGAGFIGCGGYNNALATKAGVSDKLEGVACYDVDIERAKAFASEHGMRACETIEELVGMDEVEGVVIATPNNAHLPNVEAAAAAGKHLFVDKPLANTVSDAKKIIEVAEKAGLVLSVGHNGRRRPGHRKMKQMIGEGMVGKPVCTESNFSHCGGLFLKPEHWRWTKSECPALPLTQLGVHFADTVQYLFGHVTEVASFMAHVATPAPNNDNTVQILRFEDGLLGYLGSNYASEAVYYVNVHGTEGNLYCWGGGEVRYRKRGAKEDELVGVVDVDDQVEELEEFADCVRLGKAPEVDGEAGLMAVALICAALESSEKGCAVKIEDILRA